MDASGNLPGSDSLNSSFSERHDHVSEPRHHPVSERHNNPISPFVSPPSGTASPDDATIPEYNSLDRYTRLREPQASNDVSRLRETPTSIDSADRYVRLRESVLPLSKSCE